ncbi:hypothetical protein KC318_g847 [Hortaea werneckii]|uniref:BHLH domain-containing protein n=1 Tax=Hortaea werneckii TaxID=91943 RepID=A0A3M7BGC5_HORWE|nr:hypothetical protein KC334_g550 [Hortaea werneckii]KAI7026761.1 hypothetical protein KC355_g545 [Hortaea werneckii]KAI7675596.1 hypothetical protein KC318_g847 [Hortaea werneckii]RMY22762.1 hypothetical protein D0867_02503 [Hortaea werneckii]RMY38510.1 hypothetical protein D0866_02556 [Hortaea werneckii]
MPRPNPPPTPGSSSDIRGKEADLLVPAFDLPPTAYPEQDRASSNSSAASSANGSDSSYRPASSAGPESRKRSAPHSGPVITTDDFTLPPPPTRSRKIIQMKPRGSAQHDLSAPPSQGAAKTQAAGTQSGKRKQNATGQTAAGRKIARKTAHSLIERRRRSKMNEEFGVLKDMIPACQGQEMHKLAILQASIEYLRYLEQCVSDLQAQTHSPPSLPPPSTTSTRDIQNEDDVDDNDDDDEEMLDDNSEGEEESQPTATAAPTRTNSLISLPSLSQVYPANPISPPIFSSSGATSSARHFSISSASQPSYSPYIHSNHTSPAFGPQLSHHSHHQSSTVNGNSHFGLGSPALKARDSSPSIESKIHYKNQNNSGSATTATANNRNLDTLHYLAERATVESEHLRHPQQPQSRFQSLPPASLSRPPPSHPSTHHPPNEPSTLINPTNTSPNNLENTTKPPTSSSSTTALAPTDPLDQDETSAAAVALSMLNSSTSSSSVSASASGGFTSSPLFKRRRRTSEPPTEEENHERESGTVMMAGRSWRPLPSPLDQTEEGQGSWRQRTSSSNPASVGAPNQSEILGTAETGRGSDDDAGIGGGGWYRNGSSSSSSGGGGGGGGGGGISVRDLLSS